MTKKETIEFMDRLYIEITWPQDGKRKSNDAQKIVARGYSNIDIYSPGEDIGNRMWDVVSNLYEDRSYICTPGQTMGYTKGKNEGN